MNNKFDELTRGLAQSVTRRAALKKFGVGLAGMVLACFGLANKAEAGTTNKIKKCFKSCMDDCVGNFISQGYPEGDATRMCQGPCSFRCMFG